MIDPEKKEITVRKSGNYKADRHSTRQTLRRRRKNGLAGKAADRQKSRDPGGFFYRRKICNK
jgi:hypothetical protein